MININKYEYVDLVRQSTKGSKEALEELFIIGDGYLACNDPIKAATTFKDSAISYRIATLRNLGKLEATQDEVNKLLKDLDIYREWISTFPNGEVALPRIVTGLDTSIIQAAIYGKCRYPSDPEIIRIYHYLDLALEKHSTEYASVNGNRAVFICELLLGYFGEYPYVSEFDLDCTKINIHTPIDVRVGVDLMAHKIEAKFLIQGRQSTLGKMD